MSNYFSFSMAIFISLVAFAALLPLPTLSTSLDNNAVQKQATTNQLAATVTGKDGEFYVDMLIGTPATRRSLILDTDSDLTWTDHCNKASASYATLPCNSDLCQKANGACDKSKIIACQYKYKSTNLSTFQAGLATETFTFGDGVKVPKLGFGCAPLENATGGLGLGRGPMSLVSQTKSRKFSYCLPEYDDTDKKGFLLVGSLTKTYPKMITTSLVRNPPINPSAYYINVQGMSINNARLPIDISAFEIDEKNGTGGFIMDTGCTMSYLNEKIFSPLRKELQKHISLKPTRFSDVDLPICYTIPSNKTIELPNITFHFSPSSKLTLSLGNTFREYTDKSTNETVSCLAMAMAPSSDHGTSRFGNIQLQNTVVLFDLDKQTVGFLPNSTCATV